MAKAKPKAILSCHDKGWVPMNEGKGKNSPGRVYDSYDANTCGLKGGKGKRGKGKIYVKTSDGCDDGPPKGNSNGKLGKGKTYHGFEDGWALQGKGRRTNSKGMKGHGSYEYNCAPKAKGTGEKTTPKQVALCGPLRGGIPAHSDELLPRPAEDEFWEVVCEVPVGQPFFCEVPLDSDRAGVDLASPGLGIATRRKHTPVSPELWFCVARGCVQRRRRRLEAMADLSDGGSSFVVAGVWVDTAGCVAFYRRSDVGIWDCSGQLESVPLGQGAPRVVLARRAGGASVISMPAEASPLKLAPFEPRIRNQEHWHGDPIEPWWEPVVWRRDLRGLEAALRGDAKLGARNADQDTEVHLSARRGWADGLQLLLAARAKVATLNMCNRTPLLEAARAGFVSTAAILLEAGACVDFQGGRAWEQMACKLVRVKEHRAALHHAAEAGRRCMLLLLLSARASVDLADAFGCTPLTLAAREEQLDATALLLEARADPNFFPEANSAFSAGETSLLHFAAFRGNPQLAALLLAAGALPEGANRAGLRPLHLAARGRTERHAEVVMTLLQMRADTNSKTAGGKTAAELAILNCASAGTLQALQVAPAASAPVIGFQDLSPDVVAEFFLDVTDE